MKFLFVKVGSSCDVEEGRRKKEESKTKGWLLFNVAGVTEQHEPSATGSITSRQTCLGGYLDASQGQGAIGETVNPVLAVTELKGFWSTASAL